MPTTIEVFDDEFEFEPALVALLPPLDEELRLLDDDDGDFRLEDDGDLRLEALVFGRVLFAVLFDRDELLADLPFEELVERLLCALPDFDPLELRDVCFALLDERLLA